MWFFVFKLLLLHSNARVFDPLLEKFKSLIKSHWQVLTLSNYTMLLEEKKCHLLSTPQRDFTVFPLRCWYKDMTSIVLLLGQQGGSVGQASCCLAWICTPEPTVEGRTNSWRCPRPPHCTWAHRESFLVWFKTYYIGNSDSIVERFQPPAFKWTLDYLSLKNLIKLSCWSSHWFQLPMSAL